MPNHRIRAADKEFEAVLKASGVFHVFPSGFYHDTMHMWSEAGSWRGHESGS